MITMIFDLSVTQESVTNDLVTLGTVLLKHIHKT